MAEQAELEVREAIVIRPGDHLIVRVDPDRQLTMEEVESIRHQLKERLPLLDDVTIVAADGLAVFREVGI